MSLAENFVADSFASNLDNENFKCGEIMFMRNEWRISFKCTFCNKNLGDLETFLRHSLLDHLSFTDRELAALIEATATAVASIKDEEDGVDVVNGHVEIEVQTKSEPDDSEAIYDICDSESSICEDGHKNIVALTNVLDTNSSFIEIGDKETDADTVSVDYITRDQSTLNATVVAEPKKNLKDIIAEERSRREFKQGSVCCEFCSRTFSDRRKYEQHQRNRHIKRHVCEMCNAAFADSSNFKVHRNRHLGIKPFKCKYCDKSFTTTTEVKFHSRLHTGERPYICKQCNATYTCSADLKSHQRRHNNERPFVCATCGKAFFDHKHLRDHEQGHSTERPFKCQLCDNAFTRRKALNQHLKLHSSVKEYICEFCSKEFAQKAGLHSHIKRHHTPKEKVVKEQYKE